MKILHVVQHFYPCSGGVEVYLKDLCEELIKAGHTSDVACFNTCVYDPTPLVSKETVDGITIFRFPYINLRYYKMAPQVVKLVKNYDLIHIHTIGFFSDLLVLTKPFHRKPLILTTHGAMFHTKEFTLPKQLYFYGWDRLIMKGINRTIAVSQNDYDLFSRITSAITLIPNGLHLKRYLGIRRNPTKNTFLTIGRIAKNKRLPLLIDLMAELKVHQPSVKLTIVGDDWMNVRKDLEAYAAQRGVAKNVHFAGRVSEKEKDRLLSETEFFISASEYEGFGISVLEAMAAGVPVIAHPIDSFRHFIAHEKSGFLIPLTDPRRAAQEIRALRRSSLPSISRHAREATHAYSWDTILPQIIKTYRKTARI